MSRYTVSLEHHNGTHIPAIRLHINRICPHLTVAFEAADVLRVTGPDRLVRDVLSDLVSQRLYQLRVLNRGAA